MDAERMPGDAEAAAAAAGMTDLYGRRLERGQVVSYRRDSWAAGVSESGRIVAFGRGRILIETETDIVEVEAEELLPF